MWLTSRSNTTREKRARLSSNVRHQMNINSCPKCNKQVTTAWRKMFIGPMKKIQCPDCSNNISVSWIPYLLMVLASQIILFFGGIVGLYLVKGVPMPIDKVFWLYPLLFLFGCILALPVAVYANYYLVPMVNKDA